MAVTDGRAALVTGSSRGLGAVIARRMARDGFAVAVNGRPGDEQVAAIGRRIRDDGGAAEGFCADVTDEHQVAGLVAAITDRLGPVGVLVLNATGPQPEAAAADVAWADHLAQLDFFVKSPVLLGRAVLPGMQARRPQHRQLITGPRAVTRHQWQPQELDQATRDPPYRSGAGPPARA